MNAFKKILLAGAASFAFASSVSANPINTEELLVNGGFEAPDIPNGSWTYTSNAPGWDGSNVEIWDDLDSVGAYEGGQHAELNAHPAQQSGTSFSIFQSFATVANTWYDLSFAYRARNANGDEAFSVSAGNYTASFLQNDLQSAWTVVNVGFMALDSISTVRFTSLNNGNDTTGNLLDAVSVKGPANVSEPGTLALLSLGLISFAVRARSKKA